MSNMRTALVGPICLLQEGVQSTLRQSSFDLVLEVTDLESLTADLFSLYESCRVFIVLSKENTDPTCFPIEEICRQVPSAMVLVLCENVAGDAPALISRGAANCLPTTVQPSALVEALHVMTNCTVQPTDGRRLPAEGTISPREWEVLQALSFGESNKHIGRRLGISDATVKAHIRLILKKTGCENRTQAALWTMDNHDSVEVFPNQVNLESRVDRRALAAPAAPTIRRIRLRVH